MEENEYHPELDPNHEHASGYIAIERGFHHFRGLQAGELQ